MIVSSQFENKIVAEIQKSIAQTSPVHKITQDLLNLSGFMWLPNQKSFPSSIFPQEKGTMIVENKILNVCFINFLVFSTWIEEKIMFWTLEKYNERTFFKKMFFLYSTLVIFLLIFLHFLGKWKNFFFFFLFLILPNNI